MCSMSTPSKASRGLLVPDLDTKPSSDDVATALTYGGLYTPPHSANESRRPSSQYAWSDAPLSTGPTYSQPSTPLHRIHQGHEALLRGWSEVDFASSAVGGRTLDSHFVNDSFHNHAIHTPPTSNNAQSTHCAQFSAALAFGASLHPEPLPDAVWAQPVDGVGQYNPQTACLGSELFRMTSDLPFRNEVPARADTHVKPEFSDFGSELGVSVQQNCYPDGLSYHQHPQVVVPSQLAPDAVYCQSHVAGYGSPCHSNDSYLNGFAASGSIGGSFEAIDQPTPLDAYMTHSEGEDYFLVKREAECKESKPLRSITRAGFGGSKRKNSRRTHSGKQPWHSHESFGIEVHCEGTQFRLDGPTKYNPANLQKPYACAFVLMNGNECGKRFKRSEHLKRHEGSHATHRRFHCPLDDCEKKIGRSDNACDHFKTHLKPKKPGKRNRHFEWEDLRHALLNEYDEEKAKKMIENLQRWVDAGMPEPPGNRRAK